MRKILKIFASLVLGLIVLFIITGIVLNESKPEGTEGEKAEVLTDKMLNSLNYQAYDSIRVLTWSFPRGHHFIWDKRKNVVNVKWEDYEVNFSPETKAGTAYKNGIKIEGEEKSDLIQRAWSLFANDSFWMVAPFKVRDPGTSRYYIETADGPGILVTYSSGGVTPGDSYLWVLDEDFKPKYWKMWVRIIPVGGLKFSWEGWENKEGVWFSTIHKGPLSYVMEMKNISVNY